MFVRIKGLVHYNIRSMFLSTKKKSVMLQIITQEENKSIILHYFARNTKVLIILHHVLRNSPENSVFLRPLLF